MKEPRSSRLPRSWLSALAAVLGLTLFAATVADVFGDHALGTEPQLAWRTHLLRVADALAQGDLANAELVWREAYAAALKSRHWEGMVAVGDAYRVLGARAGFRKASEAKARQTYLTALFRARTEGSVEGVLRAAERFAELGDREVVEQCIRVAWGVAAQTKGPHAEERVRAFDGALGGERARARSIGLDPIGQMVISRRKDRLHRHEDDVRKVHGILIDLERRANSARDDTPEALAEVEL